MTSNPQTIFIAVEQGFAARYLLRTDVFKCLKESGARIVILTPNAGDRYLAQELAGERIFIETLNQKAYAESGRSVVQTFFRHARAFAMNGHADLRALDVKYELFKRSRPARPLRRVLYRICLDLAVRALRKSKWLRTLVIRMETWLFTPRTHASLFLKYRPDKVVVASLGYFGYDHYLMREARSHGVKVISVILSWDNTTTKGMPGALADHVIAWTDTMKQELVTYSDVDPAKVTVGGIAHFDEHYREESFWTRERFYAEFGLDPGRRLLTFALRSPNNYPWNPAIVELLATAIQQNRFVEPCQLLVRLHPLNFRMHGGRPRFAEDTARHAAVMKRGYKHVLYDIPRILSTTLQMDMPTDEMAKLSRILRETDVLLCFYSTMVLEASIFDVPVVNVCLHPHHQCLEPGDLRVMSYPHIRRLTEASGVRAAFDEKGLIDEINACLLNPSHGERGRRTIRENECGPYAGHAGRKIGECILGV